MLKGGLQQAVQHRHSCDHNVPRNRSEGSTYGGTLRARASLIVRQQSGLRASLSARVRIGDYLSERLSVDVKKRVAGLLQPLPLCLYLLASKPACSNG